MERKLYILLDCSLSSNDKKWITGLKVQGFETIVIGVEHKLSQLVRNGVIGKAKNYWLQIKQVFRVLYNTGQNDIIIVWYSVTGQILNLISGWFGGRDLILMNFLTPENRSGFVGWMFRKTINNKRNTILVNSKESIDQYRDVFKLKNEQSAVFCHFPDVFDDTGSFLEPRWCREDVERYFFIGGMSNRDWKLVEYLAKEVPQVKFLCVALRSDFESCVKEPPSNMEVIFNLPSDEYYKMMHNAFAVLIPLRSDSVAGLITILKSIQLGVPCLVSATKATEQYYPPNASYCLIERDLMQWRKITKRLLNMDEKDYIDLTESLQKHIQKEYSPKSALLRLNKIVLEKK